MEDPRELKTKNKLKHGLFKSLERYEFSDISVALLCQTSKVSRTSFYKYYGNTYDLLKDSLETLIEETLDNGNEFFSCIRNEAKNNRPMCELIRTDKRFMPIMKSSELTAVIVDVLSSKIDRGIVESLAEKTNMSTDEIRGLIYYQIGGCITTVRKFYGVSDKEWRIRKKNIDTFLKKGYQID